MPEIKIDTKILKPAALALAEHAEEMFDRQGGRWVAVVELEAVKRSEEVKTEDGFDYTAREVKLRVASVEVAAGRHADQVRQVQRALWRLRTGEGTLDDAEDTHQAETTSRFAADLIGDDR